MSTFLVLRETTLVHKLNTTTSLPHDDTVATTPTQGTGGGGGGTPLLSSTNKTSKKKKMMTRMHAWMGGGVKVNANTTLSSPGVPHTNTCLAKSLQVALSLHYRPNKKWRVLRELGEAPEGVMPRGLAFGLLLEVLEEVLLYPRLAVWRVHPRVQVYPVYYYYLVQTNVGRRRTRRGGV